jgi:DNA-binding GntR family transcriptional regulator
MAIARAESSLLTDRVYAAIHEAIMSGELPAGTQLKVRDLAAQVGTSVMPVREAIRRLEESGLAVRSPHRGAVVKGLTVDELEDVYDVRLLLETEAARLGASRITRKSGLAMRREYDKLTRAVAQGRLVDALNYDEAILAVLYEAADNPVLADIIRGLWQRCRAYKIRGAQRAQEQADDTLWAFQPRIVEAAEQQDPTGAAEITRESLLSAKARIRATLDVAP